MLFNEMWPWHFLTATSMIVGICCYHCVEGLRLQSVGLLLGVALWSAYWLGFLPWLDWCKSDGSIGFGAAIAAEGSAILLVVYQLLLWLAFLVQLLRLGLNRKPNQGARFRNGDLVTNS